MVSLSLCHFDDSAQNLKGSKSGYKLSLMGQMMTADLE